jgi:hypothetical protein
MADIRITFHKTEVLQHYPQQYLLFNDQAQAERDR